jgi:DNA-binding transcriptional LysR family regulator
VEDLNDLMFFAKVVEHGGYSAASRALGIPKSRLSRRIAALEERLDVRLLQRGSRGFTLTSVGQPFYERCKAVLAAGAAAFEVAEAGASEPQGLLRVSCPLSLAQSWLTPLLPRFMQALPKVRVRLHVSNRRVDPIDDQVDVVLRVRRPPFEDSSLVVRPLARVNDLLVASPALVASLPPLDGPQALAHWPTLSTPDAGERATWRLVSGGQTVEVVHTPRLATEDMYALRQAAVEGVGVALLPALVCGRDIAEGRLQVLLPGWERGAGEIQAAFASRRGMLPAVRAFVDFLVANPPAANA